MEFKRDCCSYLVLGIEFIGCLIYRVIVCEDCINR